VRNEEDPDFDDEAVLNIDDEDEDDDDEVHSGLLDEERAYTNRRNNL
jgi:hypothetical protein